MSQITKANKPESYKQIKEIFNEITGAYTQIAGLVEKYEEQITEERVERLLKWWQGRLLELQGSLQKYLDTGSDEVLNTWIQYVPKMQILEAFEKKFKIDEPDMDNAAAACESAYNELISFFDTIREQANEGYVQKQLTSYITLLEEEKKKLELSK